MPLTIDEVCGVILAGGRGTRMGGLDKGLVEYRGAPLIEHVLKRLQPQLKQLLININRNQGRYAQYGLPLYADQWCDFRGPLAGMVSAFAHSSAEYLLFCPCDTPLIPNDLVERLIESMKQQQRPLAVVKTARGLQPLCCLMQRSLEPSLLAYLNSGERRAQVWVRQQQPVLCDYASDEPFRNINRL